MIQRIKLYKKWAIVTLVYENIFVERYNYFLVWDTKVSIVFPNCKIYEDNARTAFR
jgi:hypothetical protein